MKNGNPDVEAATSNGQVAAGNKDNAAGQQQTIDCEKRFKDTQGAYTKSRQEAKALAAKVKALEELTKPKVDLDEDTKNKLEDLKYSDPDAWRNEMNRLEQEALAKHRAKVEEASKEAVAAAEVERRKQVLAEFTASNPDIKIDDEVIKYDIPPRITSKLESGKIDFEQFLKEAADYLKAPKVVGRGDDVMGQPNIGQAAGSDTPSDNAGSKDIASVYKDIVL